MNVHTSKRAMLMRSVDRRNAVSAQEPKKFALSSQRKLSVLLIVGIVILSMANAKCDMNPMGPGGDTPEPIANKPEPVPVDPYPLASTLVPAGPFNLATSVMLAHGATLASEDAFSSAVAFAGDLDGDGGTVLAVGAPGDDTGEAASNKGAIYLLSYNDAGTLQSTTKIAHEVDETNDAHALAPTLGNGDAFGKSIANAGDLYGDGNTVLAVGSSGADTFRGAIYLLSFNPSGNLTASTKIARGTANGPTLAVLDQFGGSIAHAGDLDGDGGIVLAVGATGDDAGGINKGAIHLLSFNASGSLTASTEITHVTASGPSLASNDKFGNSLANAGDLDGDGGTVLAVGANGDASGKGSIYLLSFSAAGALQSTTKIADGLDETDVDSDSNAPSLANSDGFGSSLTNAGDLDGGGGTVLAVGANGDDAAGTDRGAIYLLSFDATGGLTATPTKIDDGTANGPMLTNKYRFGSSLANVGNLDGSGGWGGWQCCGD